MDDYIRELVYEDRVSIKDFGIDEKGALNKLLYDKYLPFASEMQVTKVGFNPRALKAFNDAYYVCSLILSQTNSTLELSYYIERVQIPSVVLPIVYKYLSLLSTDNDIVKRIMESIEGAAQNESTWRVNLNCIKDITKKKKFKLQSAFAFRELTPELLTNIRWWAITNRFEKEVIYKLVSGICKNKKDWHMMLGAIKDAASEYEWNYNNSLSGGFYYDEEIGKVCYDEDKPIDLSDVIRYCDELDKRVDQVFVKHDVAPPAPSIYLKNLLNQDWFDTVNNDLALYTKQWRNQMVDDLMSEYGQYIASEWEKPKRHLMVKMKLVGVLRDAGVLNNKSYQCLVGSIFPNRKTIEGKNKETLAKYMGYGKDECYFDWLKDYVKLHNHEESD